MLSGAQTKIPMKEESRHVVPDNRGGWSVRKSGATRAARVFDTKHDAVEYAKDIAKKEGGDIYVHGKDGTIRERDRYRSDQVQNKKKR